MQEKRPHGMEDMKSFRQENRSEEEKMEEKRTFNMEHKAKIKKKYIKIVIRKQFKKENN